MSSLENEVPKKLYRGITLNTDLFFTTDIEPDEIKVHYDAITNKEGREVVSGGNEYGVYMSSNFAMVNEVYGKPHQTDIDLMPGLVLANHKKIELPIIGIIYEIDTTNLDIKKPWIKDVLKSSYNNGYIGDEWITKSIPKSNYSIIKIIIGEDLLNENEVIDCTNVSSAIDTIKEKILNRKLGLVKFGNDIKNTIYTKLLTHNQLILFRKIYKDNGFYFNDDIKINSVESLIDYILCLVYNIDRDNYIKNISVMEYIYSFENKLRKVEPSMYQKELFNLIYNEINRTNQSIEKLKLNNRDTSTMENRNKIYYYLINYLNNIDLSLNINKIDNKKI